MDRLNFVKDGATRLPPGFRFQPTEEEIVFQYLARKAFSLPLPASIIPEIDICKYNPWDLPGDSEQERYFFSNMETKYSKESRSYRATSAGYWKASGKDKRIPCPRKQNIVGLRKTLIYQERKHRARASRTSWVMHEYRLARAGTNPSQNCLMQIGNWVLCCIIQRKKCVKTEDEIPKVCKNDGAAAKKLMKKEALVPPSSSASASSFSDSSVLTEVSLACPDHEENSSSSSSSSVI